MKPKKVFSIVPHHRQDKKLAQLAEKFLNSAAMLVLIEKKFKKELDRIFYGTLK